MLGRVARQSGAYALAGALLKATGLVLAPLLLNPEYLPVTDYGSFALLMVTAQLAVFVAGMGQGTALLRFMTRRDQEVFGPALPATALLLSILFAVGTALVFTAVARPLAGLLTGSAADAGLLPILGLYVALKCVATIPLTLLRVREQPGRYTVAVVLEMVALIALVYVELVVSQHGLAGLIRAYTGAAGASLLALLVMTGASISWRPDPRAFRPLLWFGFPLILASLSGWFLNAGDRYILNWLADRSAVASYEWSARLAGLINMLFVQSFQMAFTVIGLKALQDGAAGFYRRSFKHFVVFTGAAVLVLSLWTPDGMRVLMRFFDVDPHYLEARTLVFPLALGFMAYGIYIITNNALLHSGRTGVIGLNIALVAVLNAALNIALIPVLGAMGAALSTTGSYAVLAGVAAWTARNEIEVRYPWGMASRVVVLLVLLFLLGLKADGLEPAGRFAAKLGLTATYLAAIPLLRLYSREEIAAGWRMARRLTGGKQV